MNAFLLKTRTAPGPSPIKPHFEGKEQGHKISQKAGRAKTFFNTPAIYPKLSAGSVFNTHEHQADAMADRVMRMEEEEEMMQAKPLEGGIQRMCAACEDEEENLQTKPLVRMPAGEGGYEASPVLREQLQQSKGRGGPLPDAIQARMGRAFGADFSNVRVHTGGQAAAMSQSIQAKAFTHGSDVYFNKGQYQPGTSAGGHLLAHELAHVVQQGQGAAPAVPTGRIQRSGLLGGLLGAGIGGLVGAGIGALAGGGLGALVGGLVGAGVGALAGWLIGHHTEDRSSLESDAGNTEILAAIRELCSQNVNRRTARHVMQILNQLSGDPSRAENRLRVIIMELARSGDYDRFIEKIVNPVQSEFQPLVSRIEMLHSEFSTPTQNTTPASAEQREQVRDILNQGMNVTATGEVEAFIDEVDGRTFEEDVTETLEREITALTPRAQQRDTLPRFEWSRYEEIANEAKERTDDLYGHYAVGDALSATGASPNLFDVRDQAYSDADLIYFANYLVTGHNAIDPIYPDVSILSKHNADMSRDMESDILSQAITDWVNEAGNRDRILLVRRNWSGVQAGGNIYIQRWRRPDEDDNCRQFWRTFQTMIHEYLHKVTHDDYSDRAGGLGRRRQQIFTEGGTSYFDRNVWFTLWPNEISSNAELRERVEGDSYDYDASLIPDWHGYDQWRQFEEIVNVVGEENARAAYFRGEVEKIGMP